MDAIRKSTDTEGPAAEVGNEANNNSRKNHTSNNSHYNCNNNSNSNNGDNASCPGCQSMVGVGFRVSGF